MRRASRTLLFVLCLSLKIATRLKERIVCLTLQLSSPAMDFISGQLISPTNPIHRIPGKFVNNPR